MRKTITDFEFGDSREHIDMCLNCEKPFCNNCFGSLRSVKDTVRSPAGELNIRYDLPLRKKDLLVVMEYPTCRTDKEIAEKIGITLQEVNRIRHKLGLPPIRKLTLAEREEIVKPWLKR